jgi:copper chaperone CopZ
MKKIVFIMVAGMFAMNMMAENVNFKVSNMRCGGCANRITKALKANEAVSDVKVNLENKMVTVSFDEAKTSKEALLETLTNAKYQAEIVAGEQASEKKGGCKDGGCHKDGQASEKKGGCKGGGCHKAKEADAQK